MRPEDGESPLLCVAQVGELEHAVEHGGGDDVVAAEIVDPDAGLHGGVVSQPLDRVDLGVADLALDRHDAAVAETDDDVGLARSADHALAGEVADRRRSEDRRDGPRFVLGEAGGGEAFADERLLPTGRGVHPRGQHALRGDHGGGRDDGRAPLLVRRVAVIGEPRETLAVEQQQDRLHGPAGRAGIAPQSPRAERGVRQHFKVVLGDRRAGEVARRVAQIAVGEYARGLCPDAREVVRGGEETLDSLAVVLKQLAVEAERLAQPLRAELADRPRPTASRRASPQRGGRAGISPPAAVPAAVRGCAPSRAART